VNESDARFECWAGNFGMVETRSRDPMTGPMTLAAAAFISASLLVPSVLADIPCAALIVGVAQKTRKSMSAKCHQWYFAR
jgi:hypothetical protein